ncbi:TetR/AcrR family transcriptional regulator [Ruicaihuangia caeni]|uniref:TetR/AcrR family transcriptional regulator n=1 Tax=Ruicaihuangia caeni TaxID=3042517 RepID=UPI00338D6096
MSDDGNDSSQQTTRTERRRPARERLLAAVDELLYREGIAASGIDRIIDEAGIAKGTLYGNFRSKDELVDAYLAQRHQHVIETLDGIARSDGSPQEKVDAVFDYLAEQVGDEAFRGCAFVIAAAEVPDPDRPPMRWARTNKRGLHDAFVRMLGGIRGSEAIADQLCILYDGALATSAIRPQAGAVELARRMARSILDASK